jgi:putative zinc finger/helix-turn-helix YgiT family protein
MAMLINKLIHYCPFCDDEHELEVYKRTSTSIIDGSEVEHEETYYYCSIENEMFTPSKVLDQNLLKARDQYRLKTNRLMSSEIKEVREVYSLTQKEFSRLLGWGDVTIQRYEKKTIQDETYDQKMKDVRNNPMIAWKELEKNKDKFRIERYNEIKKLIYKLIKDKGIAYLKSQVLEAVYLDYLEPSYINGGQYVNINKIKSTMTYLSQYSKGLDQMKLFTLLWFIDVNSFKKYQHSITGLVYMKRSIGLLPLGHIELLSLAEDSIEIIEGYVDGAFSNKIINKKKVNLSDFEPVEIEILQEILNKFENMKSDEFNQYLQKEISKMDVKENEIIPFNLATTCGVN